MEIKIRLPKRYQAIDCLNCVKGSELWDAYFKSNPSVESDFEKMISKKQIYMALNKNLTMAFI